MASLAGKGVVLCNPFIQQPHSSEVLSSDESYRSRSPLKRLESVPTATGKGGDVMRISSETAFNQSDSELVNSHAAHTQANRQGIHRNIGKRLGAKDLGPFHAENQMPPALYEKLATQEVRQSQHIDPHTGQQYSVGTTWNELRDVMPTLAYLLHCVSTDLEDVSRTVKSATLCHPCIRHVFKLPKEGGFCGYRNMQTLCSYLAGTDLHGSRDQVLTRETRWQAKSMDVLPNIIELQHMIEASWEAGVNSHCRDETGGLVGRRVYIGTPEVQALLVALGIPASTYSIPGAPDLPACDALIETVIRHFRTYEALGTAGLQEECLASGGILKKTAAPPIFLQQPGHSLTIVGYEINGDDSASLIVLDPGFTASPAMRKLAERFVTIRSCGDMRYNVDIGWDAFARSGFDERDNSQAKGYVVPAEARKMLKVYRRDREKLSRYREFEIVAVE